MSTNYVPGAYITIFWIRSPLKTYCTLSNSLEYKEQKELPNQMCKFLLLQPNSIKMVLAFLWSQFPGLAHLVWPTIMTKVSLANLVVLSCISKSQISKWTKSQAEERYYSSNIKKYSDKQSNAKSSWMGKLFN